jgi:hypothetical protein
MSTLMTPEVYECKRNELVMLLDEVIGLLDTIPVLEVNRDKIGDELRRTRRRVFENQFTIALMAQFQGGKSTTFNALCDGMEISPRGTQLKTSATVISAQNTLDDGEDGTAEVVWRSERELLLVFGDLILPHLRRDSPDRFGDCVGVEHLAAKLEFTQDNEADAFSRNADLFKAALAKEWDLYRRNKAGYTPDALDALRIGSLVCHHYASEAMRTLRRTADFRVEDIGELVRFPKYWEERWEKCDAMEFTEREPAFAFIREVRCKVRSGNLARTGSVIIDCPGLFASRYDTMVARDILSRADAVWFLCGGKALGESELGMIREVVKIRGDRPFFTINMSGAPRHLIAEHIRPADAAYLRQQAGLEVELEEFRLYHALLALCAAQGEKLLRGEIDAHSKSAIGDLYARMNGEAPDSVETALADTIRDQLHALKVPELKTFSGLDRAGVDAARSVSGITDILSAIEGEAVRRKAASILVHNGAARVEREVRGFEGELKAIEDNAALTTDQARAEYAKAEKALKDFHGFVTDEMERIHLNDSFIDGELAGDYWEKVMVAAVDNSAKKAGAIINDLPKKYLILSPDEATVKNVILEEYRNEVEALGMQWQNLALAGRNEKFTHLLKDKVDSLNRQIHERWNLAMRSASRLEALSEPSVSPELTMTPEHIAQATDVKGDFDKKDMLLLGGIGVGSFAVAIALSLVGGPFSIIIGYIVASIVGSFFTQNKDETKDKLISATRTCYEKALKDGEKEMLGKLAGKLSVYRESYRSLLLSTLGELATSLEKLKTQAMREFERKEWDRTATANLCKEIRVNKIEPVRKRLESFQQSLIEFMPGEFEEVHCERA